MKDQIKEIDKQIRVNNFIAIIAITLAACAIFYLTVTQP
jgi:hypothetical protein